MVTHVKLLSVISLTNTSCEVTISNIDDYFRLLNSANIFVEILSHCGSFSVVSVRLASFVGPSTSCCRQVAETHWNAFPEAPKTSENNAKVYHSMIVWKSTEVDSWHGYHTTVTYTFFFSHNQIFISPQNTWVP